MLLTNYAVKYSLMLLLLSSAGCSLLPRDQVLLDRTIPHRLSKPCQATVWARQDDGTFVEQEVTLEAEWWVASPEVFRNPPASTEPALPATISATPTVPLGLSPPPAK